MAALAETYVQYIPTDFEIGESNFSSQQADIGKTDDSWKLASSEFPE